MPHEVPNGVKLPPDGPNPSRDRPRVGRDPRFLWGVLLGAKDLQSHPLDVVDNAAVANVNVANTDIHMMPQPILELMP